MLSVYLLMVEVEGVDQTRRYQLASDFDKMQKNHRQNKSGIAFQSSVFLSDASRDSFSKKEDFLDFLHRAVYNRSISESMTTKSFAQSRVNFSNRYLEKDCNLLKFSGTGREVPLHIQSGYLAGFQ